MGKKTKIRCIDHDESEYYVTKGKIYEYEDGVGFERDDGCFFGFFEKDTVEDYLSRTAIKWEIVEEKESEFKVGDKVKLKKHLNTSEIKRCGFQYFAHFEGERTISKVEENGDVFLNSTQIYSPLWLEKINPSKEKKLFRFEDFTYNDVIHCETEEEAKKLCDFLHAIGKEWCDGKSYKQTEWYRHKDEMCYRIKRRALGDKRYYKRNGHTIHKSTDYYYPEVYKGFIVGERYPYVLEKSCFVNTVTWENITVLKNYVDKGTIFKTVAEAEEYIEKKKQKEYKGFKEGQEVYEYISVIDDIQYFIYHASDVEKRRIDEGRVFHTREEAEKKREVMNIVKECKREYSLEELENSEEEKHGVSADFGCKCLVDGCSYAYKQELDCESEEKAMEFIEKVSYEDYCKYYLNLR